MHSAALTGTAQIRALGDCWELFAFPLRFALLHTSDYQLTGKVHAVGVADLMLDLFTLVEIVLSVLTLSVSGPKAQRSDAQITLLYNRLMVYLPCCAPPTFVTLARILPFSRRGRSGFHHVAPTLASRSPGRRPSSLRDVCCAYAGERRARDRAIACDSPCRKISGANRGTPNADNRTHR